MTDDLLYISDLHERRTNPKKDIWQGIGKITLKDCINGTGEMQKTTLKEILGAKFIPDDEMKFGKYKGKKLEWVKENDEGYWNWAVENVNGFEKIAKSVK